MGLSEVFGNWEGPESAGATARMAKDVQIMADDKMEKRKTPKK